MRDHVRLEIAYAASIGKRIPPETPVPGCACIACEVYGAGGRAGDVAEAERAAYVLAGFPKRQRLAEARRMRAARMQAGRVPALPSPETLSRLAGELHPERERKIDTGSTLSDRDIENARAIDIRTVAQRLGLEMNPRQRDWARCPFHADTHPSLHLNARKAAAFCNPCGRSWDAIQLVREHMRCTFREALLWLLDGVLIPGRAA